MAFLTCDMPLLAAMAGGLLETSALVSEMTKLVVGKGGWALSICMSQAWREAGEYRIVSV